MWYFSLFFPSLFVPRITAKAQGSCVLLGVVTLCQGFVRCEVWLPYVKGGTIVTRIISVSGTCTTFLRMRMPTQKNFSVYLKAC